MTSHARVLAYIAHDPSARLQDIASAVGITERRAVELDRKGNEVWQFKAEDSRVTRAFRR